MLQREEIYSCGGLIHLIGGSRCGGRPGLRPSNANESQMELQAKASQTLLEKAVPLLIISHHGRSDCSDQAFPAASLAD